VSQYRIFYSFQSHQKHYGWFVFYQSIYWRWKVWCDLIKALINLFVESAANDQATYSKLNNTSDVKRAAISEQGWRRKEPTPCRKQSMQAKQLTACNKIALACVTIQENKITPQRTFSPSTWNATHAIAQLSM